MDFFTAGIWLITFIFLIFSFIKNKDKTKKALRNALFLGKGMILSIVGVIFAIGLVLAFLPPTQIADFIRHQNFFIATVLSAGFGAITLIPAFIAFPLIGTLTHAGLGMMPAVAFLTTLTMVGIATFPLEKESFGTKYAFTRNILSFIFAIFIALIMGGIL